MEKYEKREAHPLEKYIGRLAYFCGEKLEVVGYSYNGLADEPLLIVDGTKMKGWGWRVPDARDVVFKNCENYCYVLVDDLIYKKL